MYIVHWYGGLRHLYLPHIQYSLIRADLCERTDPNRNDIKAYYHFINIFIYLSIINIYLFAELGVLQPFLLELFVP